MAINILFMILLLIMILKIKYGFHEGLAKGLNRIIITIVGLLVIIILIIGIGNFIQHNIVKVIVAIICLLIVSITYKIINLPIASLKLLSETPGFRAIDKIMGGIFGLIESVILIWFIFLILQFFKVPFVNQWIINQANDNLVVSLLYKSNYLIELMARFLK